MVFYFFLIFPPAITTSNAPAAMPPTFLRSLQNCLRFALHCSQSFSVSSGLSQPHFLHLFQSFWVIACLLGVWILIYTFITTLNRLYSDIDGQVELLFGADDTENDTVAGGQTGGQIGGQKGPQFDRRCLSNLKKSGPNVPNV